VTSGQPEADVRPVSDDGAGKVFLHFTMSLDGFIADIEGRLDWAFRFAGPPADIVTQIIGSIGAALGGRLMLSIRHDRASRAAPIIRIWVRRRRRFHTPLAAPNGGSVRWVGPPLGPRSVTDPRR
jgi:hypothetical protein